MCENVNIMKKCFFSSKLTHPHFWASTKVFEITEKASIRHQFEFQTSMKCLFKIFEAGIGKLKMPVAPMQMSKKNYAHEVPQNL